jgi:hypothetical protein
MAKPHRKQMVGGQFAIVACNKLLLIRFAEHCRQHQVCRFGATSKKVSGLVRVAMRFIDQ